jgi:ABC-type Na+ transport system ATPase subunit NatA
VLILDEPTANLDVIVARNVASSSSRARRAARSSSARTASEAERLCVVIVHQGSCSRRDAGRVVARRARDNPEDAFKMVRLGAPALEG